MRVGDLPIGMDAKTPRTNAAASAEAACCRAMYLRAADQVATEQLVHVLYSCGTSYSLTFACKCTMQTRPIYTGQDPEKFGELQVPSWSILVPVFQLPSSSTPSSRSGWYLPLLFSVLVSCEACDPAWTCTRTHGLSHVRPKLWLACPCTGIPADSTPDGAFTQRCSLSYVCCTINVYNLTRKLKRYILQGRWKENVTAGKKERGGGKWGEPSCCEHSLENQTGSRTGEAFGLGFTDWTTGSTRSI